MTSAFSIENSKSSWHFYCNTQNLESGPLSEGGRTNAAL